MRQFCSVTFQNCTPEFRVSRYEGQEFRRANLGQGKLAQSIDTAGQ